MGSNPDYEKKDPTEWEPHTNVSNVSGQARLWLFGKSYQGIIITILLSFLLLSLSEN